MEVSAVKKPTLDVMWLSSLAKNNYIQKPHGYYTVCELCSDSMPFSGMAESSVRQIMNRKHKAGEADRVKISHTGQFAYGPPRSK